MTLIPLILNFYESLDTLRQVSSSNTLETLFRRAIWVETLVSDINKQLAVRQKEYENGIINEPFYWNFWREFANHHRPDGGALKKALEDHASVTLESLHAVLTINDQPIICLGDFVSVIEKELDEMTLHLEAIRDCIINLNPEAYGDYYQKSKQKYDEASVTKAYHLWKLSVGKLTFKKLKAKQTETVANALKKGIMKYARRPTHEEILEVDEERVKHHLPEDYELPEDFKIRCAQFRTFISWEDDILHIHYNDYGRYIYSCIDKFTAEELIAIYELDMMLYLIHQDMMKLEQNKEHPSETSRTLAVEEMSVDKCFRFLNEFTRIQIDAMVKESYQGSYANLALIEITLFHHRQLKRRNSHKAFVTALNAWGIIDIADTEELDRIASGVRDKYGRLPEEGYLDWSDNFKNDRLVCGRMGEKLGPTMPYQR